MTETAKTSTTLASEETSKSSPAKKKAIASLIFPMPQQDGDDQLAHDQIRPKPQRYADRTFMPPPGTRRSMGKR